MGNFNIEVKSVGGHGCQREVKDGQQVAASCGYPGCPDCAAREFVQKLKNQGHMVNEATLTHWPGETTEVKDDLLTLIRKGCF